MGGEIKLPTNKVGNIVVVNIPQFVFGKRVTIQAHTINNPTRTRDILDRHECDQTEAKGDIKFFTRTIDIRNI